MASKEWKQVRLVFDAALQRDPEEREAFLDEFFAEDSRLRSVQAMRVVKASLNTAGGPAVFLEKLDG